MNTPSKIPQHSRSQERNPSWLRVLDFGIIEPIKHPVGADNNQAPRGLPLFEILP